MKLGQTCTRDAAYLLATERTHNFGELSVTLSARTSATPGAIDLSSLGTGHARRTGPAASSEAIRFDKESDWKGPRLEQSFGLGEATATN